MDLVTLKAEVSKQVRHFMHFLFEAEIKKRHVGLCKRKGRFVEKLSFTFSASQKARSKSVSFVSLTVTYIKRLCFDFKKIRVTSRELVC